ncbi:MULTISPECIES: hypothetical protein [Delftia]|uniref:hypothetical protein n=1 Tax=Delftia TaxID=80865 RepID=UPI0012A8DA2A|nr:MULTISPECIES: hypothetical protein [Delftia]MDH0421371.1 hypothetical protein [Delftia tsuruhatensis]QFS65306.1 hypothetical protein GCS91_13780 [Delftia tsuruhatensis]WON86882.1 hypothetical protein OK021_19240 [Delftia sp. UGAL515B_04]
MKMRYPRLATTLAIVVCGLWAPAVQANGISFENFSSSNAAQAFFGSYSMLPLMMARTSELSKLMEMMTANTGKTELMPLQMMAK